ncbi:unnamed protein product [Bubo scandiacus]
MAQPVNVAELTLPQLELLKGQLDQAVPPPREVEFLSSSIAPAQGGADQVRGGQGLSQRAQQEQRGRETSGADGACGAPLPLGGGYNPKNHPRPDIPRHPRHAM